MAPGVMNQQPVGSHRVILTICTVLATLMQSLDSTIANVALPYMQGTMSASQEEINWVLTSYIIAAAIMTAPTGFLAARFGRTRLFVTAVTVRATGEITAVVTASPLN